DPRVGDLGVGRRRAAARAVHEPRRDQTVERLADLEFPQPRILDDLVHVTRSIEQRQEALLRIGEFPFADGEAVLVDREDQIERRNLLLDQAPLIDPPGTLEEQRLRIDRDQEVLPLRTDVRLEVERALRPREQVEDRLLDLHAHVALEVGLGEHVHRDQHLAELLAMLFGLPLDGGEELLLADPIVFHQDVAQPVAPVDDRSVADAPLLEIDVPEVGAIGDGETAGLLPQCQQLEHVRERRLFERALDGHQRNSSITRSDTSAHSHTIFSRLLMPPRLENTSPDVRKPLERRVSRGAWPSSTSRARPAVSGPSPAAAAVITRCTAPTSARTE